MWGIGVDTRSTHAPRSRRELTNHNGIRSQPISPRLARMVQTQHVIAIDQFLRQDVIVVEVVGLSVCGALDDGELDLLELLALEPCALRDALLCVLEKLALSQSQ